MPLSSHNRGCNDNKSKPERSTRGAAGPEEVIPEAGVSPGEDLRDHGVVLRQDRSDAEPVPIQQESFLRRGAPRAAAQWKRPPANPPSRPERRQWSEGACGVPRRLPYGTLGRAVPYRARERSYMKMGNVRA